MPGALSDSVAAGLRSLGELAGWHYGFAAAGVGMTIGLATTFTGNLVAGWLGSFWSAMEKSSCFLMIAAAAGAAIWLVRLPLRRVLEVSPAGGP